ncbi:hypothetical protein, partial [Faecalibaculum rodentium]|uniref:hypothetical protein n=1 Tax=Faecalibaculum rodentium TaxID=1702221 RepID=UPI0025A9FDF4
QIFHQPGQKRLEAVISSLFYPVQREVFSKTAASGEYTKWRIHRMKDTMNPALPMAGVNRFCFYEISQGTII